MLKKATYQKVTKGKILPTIPEWAITTQQAAFLLRCGRSHASALLHRGNVRSCRVQEASGRICTCWHRHEVAGLAEKRNLTSALPNEPLISMNEAIVLTGLSRNTITRYAKIGLLKRYSLRKYSPGMGARISSFFTKSQVEQLILLRQYIFRQKTQHAPQPPPSEKKAPCPSAISSPGQT